MALNMRICFTPQDVHSALEALRQGLLLSETHPLTHCLSAGNRYGTRLREQCGSSDIEIFDVLTSLIRKRFTQYRCLCHCPPATSSDRKDELAALAGDFQCSNAELEAWSLLYHRYVCVHLNLSLGQMSDVVKQTERTLHRRQHLGLTRLTHDLLHREVRFRCYQNCAELRTHLPRSTYPILFGRDDFLETAMCSLERSLPSLLLYGPHGIGKTALALAIAHRIIESRQVKQVVWIKQPEANLIALTDHLSESLGLAVPINQKDIPLFLNHTKTLIVFDDIDHLIKDASVLDHIQALLSPALVIYTSTVLPLKHMDMVYLPIPDLDKHAAMSLLQWRAPTLKYFWQERLEKVFGGLLDCVGGNPGALCQALHSAMSGIVPNSMIYSRGE